jgi:hypothetical protein
MKKILAAVAVALFLSSRAFASSCTGYKVTNECVPAENILDGTLGASVQGSGCGASNLAQGVTITYGLTVGTVTVGDTSATSIVTGGGITAAGVGIINTSGKIPALTTTYLGSLDASTLTGVAAANITAGALGAGNYTDVGSVAVSTSATSAYSLKLKGAKSLAQLAATVPGALGEVYFVYDGTVDYFALSTQTVTASWLGNTSSRASNGTSAH